MSEALFIGVDGGATKSVVRLEDAAGTLLGLEVGGPASIRISVEQTWDSINKSITKLSQKLFLGDKERNHLHVGMGLAGCEIRSAYERFVDYHHPFATLIVSSDAHTACLGAHNGADGTIIIAGTGAVGYQKHQGQVTKIGGWGFPYDDEGGGAAIGLAAVKVTLKSLDGRSPASLLTQAIYTYFGNERDQLVNWANLANATAFAEIAPLVIEQCQKGDEEALQIVKQAANAIMQIFLALYKSQDVTQLPCALVGSIAPHLTPYLSKEMLSKLKAAEKTPDAGAILLVKDFMFKLKEVPSTYA